MANSECCDGVRELVQFIPFRADARADKFDAKRREGVWLGPDSRTDANIIGTECGIYIGLQPLREPMRTSDGIQRKSSQ